MNILENTSLRPYNTFHIDVLARYLVTVTSEDELIEVLGDERFKGLEILVLGGGSNILLTKDFDGLVIRNEIRGISHKTLANDEIVVTAGGGESWDKLVMYGIELGYGGLENLVAIPGSVGAAPMQNIGAYGVEQKDTFEYLEAIDIYTRERRRFNKEECMFGYRTSIFKTTLKGKYIITRVSYRLNKQSVLKLEYAGIKETLDSKGILGPTYRDVADVIRGIRNSKLPDPNILGNAGSFFKNPSVEKSKLDDLLTTFPNIPNYPTEDPNFFKLSAGWLIDQVGLKGYRDKDAGTAPTHALVLVNYGSAKGSEVLEVAKYIQAKVQEKFGIQLEAEVNVI
jgi:UDP-N-acetylmuramate dehydrogenase